MIKTSGFINKQGQNNLMGLGYWPERFFILDNNCFAYFMDNTKNDLKGVYRIGKDDVVETHDGVLSLTSTCYKDFESFGGGHVQKLNMKFAKPKDHDHWQNALSNTIKFIKEQPHYPSSCFCGAVMISVFGSVLAETTCHCRDCSFYQGTSPNMMFTQGCMTILKGNDHLHIATSTRPNTATTRGFCKDCHTLCFTNYGSFGTLGIPFERLCHNGVPSTIRPNRPKFHIHYSSKAREVKDGQQKFNDLPSSFGGSGKIVNDDGSNFEVDTSDPRKDLETVAMKEDGSRQIALVTGGNRGIGFEVCKQLAGKGFRVILSGRDQSKVEKAAEELRGMGDFEIESLVMDATSDDSVKSAVEVFASRHNSLDVLVNNVGGGFDYADTVMTVDLAEARTTMDWNLFSTWRVTKAFAPFLKTSGAGSRVVNVASGAGCINDVESGFGFRATEKSTVSAYGVSKMAVHGLTVKFSYEFKEDGIMVNSACPGYTDSAGSGQGRPVADGAASIVWVATRRPGGPTGEYFRDGQHVSF